MNEILKGILIIYIISTIFYFIYKKKTENDINTIILNLDEDNLNKYNKIKKTRTFVFIIGILVGLGLLLLTDTKEIKKKICNINDINDISDINVIS